MLAAFQSSVTVRRLVQELGRALEAVGGTAKPLAVAYAAALHLLDRWQAARAGDPRLELLHSAQPEGGSEQGAETALAMLVAQINSRKYALANFFTLCRWVALCAHVSGANSSLCVLPAGNHVPQLHGIYSHMPAHSHGAPQAPQVS